MSDPRLYVLPRFIFLSPRLVADGVAPDGLRPTLKTALARRDRTDMFHGSITDSGGREVWWSMEVPNDSSMTVSEFYLKCRYEDELFDPFENMRPFWEDPDYQRPK